VPGSAGRGRRTREQLIDAAAALVGEVGWGAVTTRLVAERAGVNGLVLHRAPDPSVDFRAVADPFRRLVAG
jgi:AcrR family transcriptional regulator